MVEVSDVLTSREVEPPGLQRMIAISLTAHVVLTVVLLLAPSITPRTQDSEDVMTISLGGAPGPRVGGMTPMGGAPVQAPSVETAPPRRVQPRAAEKPPEMVLPTKPAAKPPPKVREAPKDARGVKPSQGDEPRPGSTPVDTGGRGTTTGLTQGGGGAGAYLDVANFCCPEYLSTMVQLIQRNWNSRQEVAGQTVMKFVIERDGRISQLEVEQSSGYFALDQTAQRALLLTRQLPALPPQYTEDQLTVHLVFRYQR
jgi:TonB family protein